jgi:hypothetical protein
MLRNDRPLRIVAGINLVGERINPDGRAWKVGCDSKNSVFKGAGKAWSIQRASELIKLLPQSASLGRIIIVLRRVVRSSSRSLILLTMLASSMPALKFLSGKESLGLIFSGFWRRFHDFVKAF